MRAPRRSVSAYLSALFLGSLALAVLGFDRHDAILPPEPAAAVGGVPDLSGTWQGFWYDSLFFATGPVEWMITQDATTMSMTGTNDLTVLGFGLGPAEPIAGSGTIISNVMSGTYEFTGLSALTGGGTFVVTGAGPDNMLGSGNTGAPPNFGDYIFILSATSTSIVGTFNFITPGGGYGAFEMTRTSAVDPESWATIKEKYRDED